MFVYTTKEETKYVIPMAGNGLWGPVWGFIAIDSDKNTIADVVFDHKSETPGLGAEISLGWFQEPFIGKQIFKGAELVSINVVKGGAKDKDMHAVDGISGGTITSDGVTDMLLERLNMYEPYFRNNKLKKIDLISSHGHTVYHQPKILKTLQIGSGKVINKVTGVKTVNNFREQDVKLGGEGAPLVPIGDKILFKNYKYCLNLGGFVNISIKNNDQILAYDLSLIHI